MATVKFFTRTNDQKSDKHVPIYCRFTSGRATILRTKTNFQVKPSHFNNKTGTYRNKVDLKTYKEVVQRLSDLQTFIFEEYAKLTNQPDIKWLKKTIDRFHYPDKHKEKVITLFTFIREFIDKAPARPSKTNRPVCYKQIREYERTFHYLKEYAASKNRKIDFKDVDLNFYYEFVEYLQGLNLSQNTIGKKVQTLKIFLNAATDQNINSNQQYRSHRFAAMTEVNESIYLDETELQKIADLDLSDNERLDKARDLFLIGCWTGLRYSDWDKVTPANIKDGFLELRQQKTGGAVVIPMHEIVEKIMDKYKGKLPRVISNQKFNDYLKEVAEKAELNEKVHKSITKGGVRRSTAYVKHELVTTHTGRRSFATNLYKAGLPTYSIMQVTGHKTEAAFLKYIKVTPREHAQKLKEFWQNRPQMKVV